MFYVSLKLYLYNKRFYVFRTPPQITKTRGVSYPPIYHISNTGVRIKVSVNDGATHKIFNLTIDLNGYATHNYV